MNSHTKVDIKSSSLKRTPTGNIFGEELKTIYSLLIISLDLHGDNTDKNKSTFSFGTKQYEYTMSVPQALESMKNLSLKAVENKASITILYKINSTTAFDLICRFMAAKLLHTPADRTRSEPKEKVMLQPTPKGVAILQEYCQNIGLRKVPRILHSDLNSMMLFNFERSTRSDKILVSEGLITILFLNLMGPSPNIWSPSSADDILPPLDKLMYKENDFFDFGNIGYLGFHEPKKNSSEIPFDIESIIVKEIARRRSPLAHKYFTNPNSDSHVQYYVSEKGVRISLGAKSDKHNFDEFVFSTKSLWQWVMDCTDILTPEEGCLVVYMLIKFELLQLCDSKSNIDMKSIISKKKFCKISPKGLKKIMWLPRNVSNNLTSTTNSVGDDVTELYVDSTLKNALNNEGGYLFEDSNSIGLDYILKEPGLRHLFKKHLQEEHCSENLSIILELNMFLKLMDQLNELLNEETKKKKHDNQMQLVESSATNTYRKSNISRLANSCLEISFHIYSTYVMIGAPFEVNINSQLKDDIEAIIIDFKRAQKFSDNKIYTATSELESNLDIENIEVPKKAHLKQRVILRDKRLNENTYAFDKHYITKTGSSDINLREVIVILNKVLPYFEDLNLSIYKMLETDSLGKFKRSKKYLDAVDLIFSA